MTADGFGGSAIPIERNPALDSEFTLDSIADLESVRARRARASRDALAAFDPLLDVAYGDGPDETLILFRPPAAGAPPPVQVFIHGGFWSSLAAADFTFLAPGFVPQGAALALIDYPLIPRVRFSQIVRSCLGAVDFLYRGGEELGIDPTRLFLSGSSAGGHLVAEVMDRDRLREVGLPADAVKGGTAISGLYDLTTVAASDRNEYLAITDEEVEKFSPLLRPANVAAPIIVAVGGDETAEFLRQSANFAEHCRAGGAAVEHIVVPATNHLTVVLDAFADPAALLNGLARRQMGLG